MTDEKKKINYLFVSKQLESLGWRIISGGVDRSDSKWEHKLISRRFSTYEAALCHNLLVNICRLNKDDIIYNTYLYMLRLLADGWSIDTSELYFDNVYISINDQCLWWRQINAGGKRHSFEEAKSFIEPNEELDYFFSEYLKQRGEKYVLPIPPFSISGSFPVSGSTEAFPMAIDDLNKYVSIEITDEALKIVLDKKLLVFIGNDIRENLMRLQKNSQALVDDLERIMRELVALNEKIG